VQRGISLALIFIAVVGLLAEQLFLDSSGGVFISVLIEYQWVNEEGDCLGEDEQV